MTYSPDHNQEGPDAFGVQRDIPYSDRVDRAIPPAPITAVSPQVGSEKTIATDTEVALAVLDLSVTRRVGSAAAAATGENARIIQPFIPGVAGAAAVEGAQADFSGLSAADDGGSSEHASAEDAPGRQSSEGGHDAPADEPTPPRGSSGGATPPPPNEPPRGGAEMPADDEPEPGESGDHDSRVSEPATQPPREDQPDQASEGADKEPDTEIAASQLDQPPVGERGPLSIEEARKFGLPPGAVEDATRTRDRLDEIREAFDGATSGEMEADVLDPWSGWPRTESVSENRGYNRSLGEDSVHRARTPETPEAQPSADAADRTTAESVPEGSAQPEANQAAAVLLDRGHELLQEIQAADARIGELLSDPNVSDETIREIQAGKDQTSQLLTELYLQGFRSGDSRVTRAAESLWNETRRHGFTGDSIHIPAGDTAGPSDQAESGTQHPETPRAPEAAETPSGTATPEQPNIPGLSEIELSPGGIRRQGNNLLDTMRETTALLREVAARPDVSDDTIHEMRVARDDASHELTMLFIRAFNTGDPDLIAAAQEIWNEARKRVFEGEEHDRGL